MEGFEPAMAPESAQNLMPKGREEFAAGGGKLVYLCLGRARAGRGLVSMSGQALSRGRQVLVFRRKECRVKWHDTFFPRATTHRQESILWARGKCRSDWGRAGHDTPKQRAYLRHQLFEAVRQDSSGAVLAAETHERAGHGCWDVSLQGDEFLIQLEFYQTYDPFLSIQHIHFVSTTI
jgi:hypothetical protein